MEKTTTEKACNLAEIARDNMPDLIDKIRYRRKPISLPGCYGNLSGFHLRLAIYDYFVDSNQVSFKQHLHVATRLSLASIELDDYQRFSTINEIFYALFSDNPVLVDAVSRLAPHYFASHCHNPLASQFIVHMWQLAIRGDYVGLQDKLDKLAKHGRKAMRKEVEDGKSFFNLLMREDRQALRTLIQKNSGTKGDAPLIEDFMSTEACLQTKVCWLKGIDVQIESPLVPMALMPVEPLPHYDDVYDFLQPGWVPPSEGILGKLSRWFSP